MKVVRAGACEDNVAQAAGDLPLGECVNNVAPVPPVVRRQNVGEHFWKKGENIIIRRGGMHRRRKGKGMNLL